MELLERHKLFGRTYPPPLFEKVLGVKSKSKKVNSLLKIILNPNQS